MSDITIIIKTHELDYVMSELLNRYYKTWFRKKYYKNICNKLHKYMHPNDKGNLIK